jgi:flagellar M-ring protein FliF
MFAQLKMGFENLRLKNTERSSNPASFIKLVLPIIVLAIAISVLLMLYLWHDDSNYKPVFGNTEKIAAADMMAVLDSEHIKYRLHPQSGQVLVENGDLGRVRMLLAAKGVVAKLPAGLELLDKNDPLGVSQFVQDVRFRRGLEGELVQSILALEPIANARVHLSIARSSSFVDSGIDKSSASVIVSLKRGQKLNQEQIAAIVNLVAGSVSSLSPQKVTLVDEAGSLLSARLDAGAAGFSGNENDSASRYREETLRSIRDLLDPVLGADNFKVSVTADVDNDQVEETREQYGAAPKITSEATRDEQTSEKSAIGIPGSLSNRPVNADPAKPETDDSRFKKNAMTRQYAYDKSITSTKKARGALRRLNVAVVLSSAAAPSVKAGWSPAQIANIEKILRNGLGIDNARGDQLMVSTLPFTARPVATPWWQERSTIYDAISALAYVLGLLLVFFFVLRPVFKLLKEWMSKPATPLSLAAPPSELDITPASPALAAEGYAKPATAHGTAMPVVPLLENYDLPPAGSSVDVLVDHLKELAAKEPERVAEVVKQWVQKDGRNQ